MDPRHLFIDARMAGCCVYCGGSPDSRDHSPSKVLLDDPLPPELPVVDACNHCNNSFSLDEQYLACAIETTVCGSADARDVSRPKIKRILTETGSLAARLAAAKRLDHRGAAIWDVELDRVRRVILKLARGHVAHELGLLKLEEPEAVSIAPFVEMSTEEKREFELTEGRAFSPWPEIGSRAFIAAVQGEPSGSPWKIVQEGRYRYRVSQADGDFVHVVLSEYLACQIGWY